MACRSSVRQGTYNTAHCEKRSRPGSPAVSSQVKKGAWQGHRGGPVRGVAGKPGQCGITGPMKTEKSVSRWKEEATLSNGVKKPSKVRVESVGWIWQCGGCCRSRYRIRVNRKRGSGNSAVEERLQKGAKKRWVARGSVGLRD